MSHIISDESGTSAAVHPRDAWGWPRDERPSYRHQPAPTLRRAAGAHRRSPSGPDPGTA